MIDLAIGAAVLALLVWLGRGSAPRRSSGAWQIVGGVAALAVIVAAVVVLLRGGWVKGLPLLAVGLGLLTASRTGKGPARPATPKPAPAQGMSRAEARSMLGVEEGATPGEVEAAYKRLMLRVHPDHGGASGLAAQLNAARAVLLKR